MKKKYPPNPSIQDIDYNLPVYCWICGKISTTFNGHHTHHRRSHKGAEHFRQATAEEITTLKGIEKTKNQKFICPDCGKEHPNKRSLQVHYGRVHGPNAIRKQKKRKLNTSKLPLENYSNHTYIKGYIALNPNGTWVFVSEIP